MTVIAISDRLKEKAIQVELRATGLAFIPKSNLDDGIREVLAIEGKGLYESAIEIRDALATLGKKAEADPGGWSAIHKRIVAGTPCGPGEPSGRHFDAYGYLAAWSGALLMRSKAIKAIKRSLPPAELNGRKADISWTGRFLSVVEKKLVGFVSYGLTSEGRLSA